ncbi:MAG: hypothetical protein BGO52_15475 [Sphingobacteriales bacterium 44-61]|nr:MAG: hypothetical protein BGO52_15475 [Sphingobacteriales bacterium 44-61]
MDSIATCQPFRENSFHLTGCAQAVCQPVTEVLNFSSQCRSLFFSLLFVPVDLTFFHICLPRHND